MKIIEGNIIDVVNNKIFPGKIEYSEKIEKITKTDKEYNNFILPGLIDSHVHIESSMLIPSEFAKIAFTHGMVATVSDPHEMANVLGIDGVRYMIENGNSVPFKFFFGVPSCVPATPFETAGGKITPDDAEELFKKDKLLFLSEMMNVPGVIYDDENVVRMLNTAKKYNRKIDGHAPGLRGADLKKYISAGISTDHEAFTYDEGLEKIKNGMKIQIREGSAAKNFNDLINLLNDYPNMCMFCSDDLHPDDLVKGHINLLVKRAIKKNIDIFKILRAASYNPVMHYGLDVGLLRINDSADFIEINNIDEFDILKTVIKGQTVYENNKVLINSQKVKRLNNFNSTKISTKDIAKKSNNKTLPVIKILDGQLVTIKENFTFPGENDYLLPDVEQDILKIIVVNRYNDTTPAIAYIKGFGLKQGAIASSVAHDSHNIIAVGTNDEDICNAVNLIIENKGGISVISNDDDFILPLPIAGLMTDDDGKNVANSYQKADKLSKELGCRLKAPFMTLSFMALLVIPSIKISDKGLFDSDKFEFINM